MVQHWGYGFFGFILVLLGAYDGYKSYFTRAGTVNLNRAIFGAGLGTGLFLMSSSVMFYLG